VRTEDVLLSLPDWPVVTHTSKISTMSEVDGRFVKQGLWTNLEQGEIMGKTITTDTRTGTIIIALMAILSTVGKCCILLAENSSKTCVTIRDVSSLEFDYLCIPSSSSYWRDS
jgi:hypothetical protein